MNKQIIISALIMLTLGSLTTYSAPAVSADWIIDRSGTLLKIDPRILGDKNESNQENNKENESELAQKASEKAKEELEKKIEVNAIKAETSKVEKESEIEVEGNKIKIKQKIKDATGKETETEMQLENGEELQIESREGDEAKKLKLKANDDDSLELENDGIKVRTNLPISLNENNELVVTRPDGTTKIVTVLPSQAMQKLKEQQILTSIDSEKNIDGSQELPELEEEDGESIYKVDGLKEEKILGIFKISYKTKAIVSAETGELVRIELSKFDRFLSLFSF